ncbi:MAG: hypothetical protein IKN75_02020 [Prevotella sp.]|nr:hypothetical protein [Prevotella sp.]
MNKRPSFNIEEYRRILLRQPNSRIRAVREVLACGSYDTIKRYYSHTPHTFMGMFKGSFNYLKRKSYNHIYSDNVTSLLNPVDYVGLLSFVLPFFEKDVNDYISKRNLFEYKYLCGDYEGAQSVLEYVNDNISYSRWAAVNTIKLGELQGGLDYRQKRFNDICAQGLMPMLQYQCDQARESASIEASSQMFADSRKKDIKSQGYSEYWQEAYLYANLYPTMEIRLCEWLSYDFKSSLIDLYNNFVLFLPKLVTYYRDNESFQYYLREVVLHIKDYRIAKFCYLMGLCGKDQLDSCFSSDFDLNVFITDVEKAVSEGKLIGVETGTLKERMEYHLWHYMSNIDKSVHLSKLENIIQSNISFVPFFKLYYILKDINEKNLSSLGADAWMCTEKLTEIDATFYERPSDRVNFINTNNLNAFPSDSIHSKLTSVDFSQILISGDRTQFVDYLAQAVENNLLPEYSKGPVVGFLFEQYLKQQKFDKAVLLYVNFRLENSQVAPQIDKSLVSYYMVRSVDASLSCSMELAVFYRMINAKAAKISANATRCILSMELEKPGDMECDGTKLSIFFMDKVLDCSTLELSPIFYDTALDVFQDRIRICRKLKAVTGDKKYNHEINHLVTEIGVQDFLDIIEGSKIDVDELLLKRHELGDAKEVFDLYLGVDPNLKQYMDENLLKGLFPKEIDKYEKEKKQDKVKEKEPSEMQEVPYKFILFSNFILKLRDAFLLNDNAGLDYYLSSRVRHGTIKNQLRHHLQINGLTTRKSEAGNYDLNIEWVEKKLGLTGESYTKALDLFLLFSKNVDDIITRLKDEKVQVKTENHNSNLCACFDLSLEHIEHGIYELYQKDSTDFVAVVDDAFDMFWKRIEECFIDMKDAVKQAENALIGELDNLFKGVKSIVPSGYGPLSRFRDTITTCKTYLQQDCKAVGDWFQRSQAANKPFTMEELVKASVRGINQYCETNIRPQIDNTSQTKFDGKNIGHFYAMFHDLLNNINEYYESNHQKESPCWISISEKDGLLVVQLTNHLQEKDIDKAQESINKFYVAKTKSGIVKKTRMEGNTGFFKINNVVNYFLACERNAFEMRVKDSEFITDIIINMENIRYVEDTVDRR